MPWPAISRLGTVNTIVFDLERSVLTIGISISIALCQDAVLADLPTGQDAVACLSSKVFPIHVC